LPKWQYRCYRASRELFSNQLCLFIYSVVLYITWRDDHVHGTVGIYIAWRNDHVRCRLYYSVRLAVDMDIHGYIHGY